MILPIYRYNCKPMLVIVLYLLLQTLIDLESINTGRYCSRAALVDDNVKREARN